MCGKQRGGGSKAKETELNGMGQGIAVPKPSVVSCWLCAQTLHLMQSLSEMNKHLNGFFLFYVCHRDFTKETEQADAKIPGQL